MTASGRTARGRDQAREAEGIAASPSLQRAPRPNKSSRDRGARKVRLGVLGALAAVAIFSGGYLVGGLSGNSKAEVLQSELTLARAENQKFERALQLARQDNSLLSQALSEAEVRASAAEAGRVIQPQTATRKAEEDDDANDSDGENMTERQAWLWDHQTNPRGPVGIDSPARPYYPGAGLGQ